MNLFIFGCSNSATYHDKTKTYREYRDYKGGVFPKTWSEILAEKFNRNLINYSIPGGGNDSIKMEFVKHVRKIQERDIVIIGWTFIERFLWTNRIKNDWDHYQYQHSEDMDISEGTHNEIILHRSHNPSNYLHIKHIYEWIDMINYISDTRHFKVFYWDCDGRIFAPYFLALGNSQICLNRNDLIIDDRHILKQVDGHIFDYVKKNNGERIFEETNNLIEDYHWGESGHIVVADKFYNHISEQTKFI